MLSQLITSLNQVNLEIEQATQTFNLDQLNELDELYTELWDKIYSFTPSSNDEAKTMALYLLNELASRSEHGEDISQVRSKIVNLFSQNVCYQEPLQAYGT